VAQAAAGPAILQVTEQFVKKEDVDNSGVFPVIKIQRGEACVPKVRERDQFISPICQY
jgi:hypothetical protein